MNFMNIQYEFPLYFFHMVPRKRTISDLQIVKIKEIYEQIYYIIDFILFQAICYFFHKICIINNHNTFRVLYLRFFHECDIIPDIYDTFLLIYTLFLK